MGVGYLRGHSKHVLILITIQRIDKERDKYGETERQRELYPQKEKRKEEKDRVDDQE